MISSQPIHEGTIVGVASLEYIKSGAALKCQSREGDEGHAVEYALLFLDIHLYNQSFLRSLTLWKMLLLQDSCINTGEKMHLQQKH